MRLQVLLPSQEELEAHSIPHLHRPLLVLEAAALEVNAQLRRRWLSQAVRQLLRSLSCLSDRGMAIPCTRSMLSLAVTTGPVSLLWPGSLIL